jgi:hypothetical protein
MGHKAIFRVKKLPSRGNVGGSGDHNFRGRETLNADPNRLTLNQHTGATSTPELFAALDARLAQLDEIDPHAVPLVEMLVTASHAAFKEGGGKVNSTEYFDDAVAWVQKKFGAENLIATSRHYDELTPHLILYVVPVREVEAKTRKRSVITGKDPETGKQVRETREYPMPARSVLSSKHWFDGRNKLSILQTEFAAQVGALHGLERGVKGSKARHVTVQQFYRNISMQVTKHPQPLKLSLTDRLTPEAALRKQHEEWIKWARPVFARAQDRDNQAVTRSNPSDRARAEAAETLNKRNSKQIQHLRTLLAEAEGKVAASDDLITQMKTEIEHLTQELVDLRRIADAQQDDIESLRLMPDDVNLDIDLLSPR